MPEMFSRQYSVSLLVNAVTAAWDFIGFLMASLLAAKRASAWYKEFFL